MKVRSRLVLAFTYILLVVIIALELPLAITLRERARSELETKTLANAQLIAAQIGREKIDAPKALAEVVDSVATQVGGRVVVVGSNGRLLADSEHADVIGSSYVTSARPELVAASQGRPDTVVRYSDDLQSDLLAVAVPIIDEGQVGALRITMPMADVQANVRRTTAGLLVIGLAGLAAGLVIALALSASIAKPLTRLVDVATRFGRGDLSARVGDLRGPREIEELASTFDDMADKTELSIQAEQAFAHNASHQLRTPLTGMKLRLESAAAVTADPAVRRQVEAAEEETDRLSAIVDRLLPGGEATIDGWCDLVGAAHRAAGRSDARGEIKVVADDGPVDVRTDPLDAEQILDNLVDNAFRHGGSHVTLTVSRGDADGVLVVADDGPGLSEEDRALVWQRFTRGRDASAGGFGLGLPIVRELARRAGGDATITGNGGGLTVEVRLPLTSR